MRPAELITERLVLGAFRPADAAAVHAGCQDAEVRRWRAAPSPFTTADSLRFVRETVPAGWAGGSEFHWAIRRKGAVGLIGVIGIGVARGDVGYWLDARWRGNGFATEALGAVAAFRFATGQRVIRWECLAGNLRSARVAAAVGFRYLGVREHAAPGDAAPLAWWTAELAPTDGPRSADGWPAEVGGPLASCPA